LILISLVYYRKHRFKNKAGEDDRGHKRYGR
jgi:hypothetical protein